MKTLLCPSEGLLSSVFCANEFIRHEEQLLSVLPLDLLPPGFIGCFSFWTVRNRELSPAYLSPATCCSIALQHMSG